MFPVPMSHNVQAIAENLIGELTLMEVKLKSTKKVSRVEDTRHKIEKNKK